ncbi:MAG: hypothetical protein LC637_10925 [Xanthomonadaceae bacterium]|nr:hypothetical protein [Xanthomonadaceae bacterium]
MNTLKLSNLTLAISLLIGAQVATAAGGPIYGAFDKTDGISHPIEATATIDPDRIPDVAEPVETNRVAVFGAFEKRQQGTIVPSQAGYGEVQLPYSQVGFPGAAGGVPSNRFGTFVHIDGITFPAGSFNRTGSGRSIDRAVALAVPTNRSPR